MAGLFSNRLASTLLAFGLSLTALIVSRQFGFHFVTAKFLAICVTLCALATLVLQRGAAFQLTAAKSVRWTTLAVLFFAVLPVLLYPGGERVTGLSQVILWLLLVLSVSALAVHEGTTEFLKNFLWLQVPFIAFSYLYLHFNHFVLHDPVKPFFGNPNVTSNYLALTMLELFFCAALPKNRLHRAGCLVLAGLGFLLLFFFVARGALLGLLLGSAYFGWNIFQALPERRNFLAKRKSWIVAALLVIVTVLGYFVYLKGFNTLRYRYSFWANTACLIKDHPLGVGPGAFEYVFQHYNGKCVPTEEIGEGSHIRNPHNMFIEFFAELGIAGGLAIMALFAIIFFELRRQKSKKPLEVTWVFSAALVIVGIALFEFPQDTPYTFFFTAVIGGLALAVLPGARNRSSAYLRSLNLGVAFLLLMIFSLKAYSDHLTLPSKKDSLANFKTACALDKENWRACTFLALSHIQAAEFEAADKIMADLDRRFSRHHSQMHLRGVYALRRGNQKEACREFRAYHELFGGKSSKEAFLKENCQ